MDTPLGAYGLTVTGLELEPSWLVAVGPHAHEIRVRSRVEPAIDRPSAVDDEAADLHLRGGGRLTMARSSAIARFSFPGPCSALDVLHPFLAPAAALAQLWHGNEAIHAGAYVTPDGGGAVALLAGERGGKSTTLAELAVDHNVTVLADDLVVIESGAVHPGPRCIDVRADAPLGDRAGGVPVRGGVHRRVPLPPAAATPVPVAGVVVLDWSPRTELRELPMRSRLAALAAERMFGRQLAVQQGAAFELLTVPWARLTRPPGALGLQAAAKLLLSYP
jgi:hypothetical protein